MIETWWHLRPPERCRSTRWTSKAISSAAPRHTIQTGTIYRRTEDRKIVPGLSVISIRSIWLFYTGECLSPFFVDSSIAKVIYAGFMSVLVET